MTFFSTTLATSKTNMSRIKADYTNTAKHGFELAVHGIATGLHHKPVTRFSQIKAITFVLEISIR